MSDLNSFIEEELNKRKADYLTSPAYIIEHYNIEKANIQAYNGRQLLEMLQNADDASETAIEKRVLIQLKDNVLTISNNGEPFNEDGFRSIIDSNLSPKALQQNKIGQKGLGFRSILSWADEVIIESGATKLVFSPKIAELFLKMLLNESEKISDFIRQNSKAKMPIATLRVPKILNGDGAVNDYDTTIAIRLNKNIIDNVQSQILSVINKETLIFLNNIESIEIDSPKRKIIFRKSYPDKTKRRVVIESRNLLENVTETKTWNIKRRSGTHKGKNYELAVAWNDNLDDSANVLFSYFKTDVRFPFPALLHGTFELTQDRNQLVNDTEGHNEFLAGELSQLLIEAALEIASNQDTVSYLPLKLLNIDFDKADSVLQKFMFKETLIEKIKSSKVFPTVNNSYISHAEKPVFYDQPVAQLLHGDDVDNLMPVCNDESVVTFLQPFMFNYTVEWFMSIISHRASEIEIPDLAKLIYYFLEYEPYKNKLASDEFNLAEQDGILLDSEGNLIKWGSNIFIPPQENRKSILSKALNIRFLDQDLLEALMREYKTDNIDIILAKLKPFGIKKYSFIQVAETLIQHYNSKERLDKKDVMKLHSLLFPLFRTELKSGEPFPLSTSIDTPVISKSIKKAREVYFGKHYGIR